MNLEAVTGSSLSVRWPLVARVAWVAIAAPALAVSLAAIPARHSQLLEFVADNERAFRDLGLSGDFYAVYLSVLGIATVLTHIFIAGLVTLNRSDDWVAFLVSVTLVTNGAISPLSPLHALVTANPGLDPLANLMIYFGVISSVTVLYLFPNGRLVPWWTLLLALAWFALSLPAVFFADSIISFLAWPLLFQVLILLTWSGSGVFAQLYRYVNVSSPLQQQQAKWAVFGLGLAVLGPMAYFLSPSLLPSLGGEATPNLAYQRIGSSLFTASLVLRVVGSTVFTLLLLFFPVSFAIAILRYKLWDIEVVINRTLVYATLTITLVTTYLISVVLLQLVFRAITGQGNNIAIVISTLAIAALFQPLRRRIQDLIDRKFYRGRYDAAQTLETFAATARSEVDLERLSGEIVSVARETMQSGQVSLWLKKEEQET